MAAKKLLVEVEKHFRKVDESVLLYDELWQELYDYNTQDGDGGAESKRDQLKRKKQCKKFTTQDSKDLRKDKLVADLEREIKRLHRYGDQIKAWLRASDIKDKDNLNEYKKKVEIRYKRGKEFYKDGISSEPKDVTFAFDAERLEMVTFIQDSMDKLQVQIESMETEQLQIEQAAKKNKRVDKEKEERAAQLEALCETSQWHLQNLEVVLRALRNLLITPEECESIQYGLEHYVDHNQDEDFAGADMELFLELGLDGLQADSEPEDDEHSPGREAKSPQKEEREKPRDDHRRKRKEKGLLKEAEKEERAPPPPRIAREDSTFSNLSANSYAPARAERDSTPPPAPAPYVIEAGRELPAAVLDALNGNRSPPALILALVSAGLSQEAARQAWRSGANLHEQLVQLLADKGITDLEAARKPREEEKAVGAPPGCLWMDYDAGSASEITAHRGDRFAVLQRDESGWTRVRVDTREGWIPDLYTQAAASTAYASHELVAIASDFPVDDAGEGVLLPLSRGDQVHVVTTSGEWAYGYMRGRCARRGWFPQSFQVECTC